MALLTAVFEDQGSKLSMSLTITRGMFTSAKLPDDVQGGVTISTVVVVLALAHTHTHTHRHVEPSSDIIEVMVRTKTVMASSPLPMAGGNRSSNRCDSIQPKQFHLLEDAIFYGNVYQTISVLVEE